MTCTHGVSTRAKKIRDLCRGLPVAKPTHSPAFRALDTHDLRRGLPATKPNRTLACRFARSTRTISGFFVKKHLQNLHLHIFTITFSHISLLIFTSAHRHLCSYSSAHPHLCSSLHPSHICISTHGAPVAIVVLSEVEQLLFLLRKKKA